MAALRGVQRALTAPKPKLQTRPPTTRKPTRLPALRKPPTQYGHRSRPARARHRCKPKWSHRPTHKGLKRYLKTKQLHVNVNRVHGRRRLSPLLAGPVPCSMVRRGFVTAASHCTNQHNAPKRTSGYVSCEQASANIPSAIDARVLVSCEQEESMHDRLVELRDISPKQLRCQPLAATKAQKGRNQRRRKAADRQKSVRHRRIFDPSDSSYKDVPESARNRPVFDARDSRYNVIVGLEKLLGFDNTKPARTVVLPQGNVRGKQSKRKAIEEKSFVIGHGGTNVIELDHDEESTVVAIPFKHGDDEKFTSCVRFSPLRDLDQITYQDIANMCRGYNPAGYEYHHVGQRDLLNGGALVLMPAHQHREGHGIELHPNSTSEIGRTDFKNHQKPAANKAVEEYIKDLYVSQAESEEARELLAVEYEERVADAVREEKSEEQVAIAALGWLIDNIEGVAEKKATALYRAGYRCKGDFKKDQGWQEVRGIGTCKVEAIEEYLQTSGLKSFEDLTESGLDNFKAFTASQ
jgi:hypothetical protein